jgi:UDP-2,3-diacylglucosamine pyrophosphatase LpxH
MGSDRNILVISDLHLGEDLRPGVANLSHLRHLVKLERALEAFLTHHTRERLDGKPWTLVVNGDMVDFLAVQMMPEAGDEADDEDRLYGLGFDEACSQKKLERVIVRHTGVFSRLAEFVGAGNELVIVVGNHDPEFHYPRVQRTLVEWLAGFALGAGADDTARAELAARVRFCDWFFYEPDLVYIEHGHQYDEFCAVDYLLNPVKPAPRGGRKSAIALSIAHAGMRYFVSRAPQYDPRNAEVWGILDYLRWAMAQGFRGIARLFYFYGLTVWRVVESWYALRRADAERRAVHHDRLRALARSYELAEDKLIALDRLHRQPVTRRLFAILSAFMMDRLLIGVAGLSLGVALAAWLDGVSRLVAPLMVLAFCALLAVALTRLRGDGNSSPKLRAATRLVKGLICAPFIVFGHSHTPEQVALGDGTSYFNTGTWASDDEKSAFTHLFVRRSADGVKAELRVWRDGESRPYRVDTTDKGA